MGRLAAVPAARAQAERPDATGVDAHQWGWARGGLRRPGSTSDRCASSGFTLISTARAGGGLVRLQGGRRCRGAHRLSLPCQHRALRCRLAA